MAWPPEIPPCPKPLRKFFQALIDRATASWPIDGIWIKCADGVGGRSINFFGGGTGSGATGAGNFPFQIMDASEEAVNKVKGYEFSYVFTGTDMTAPATITGTGLDTAATVSVGNVCYLEVGLDASLAVTYVDFTIGAQWTEYPDMFEIDDSDEENPFMFKVFLLIAQIVAVADPRPGSLISGDSTLKIIQRWRNNVKLVRESDSGYAVLFPTAWA